MSELKKCPFCGNIPRMKSGLNSEGEQFYQVTHDCMNLLSQIKTFCYKTEPEAIAAWNRRAKPENEPLVRCGECAKFQSPNCAAKHEQALMDFCSHGVRKPERSEG